MSYYSLPLESQTKYIIFEECLLSLFQSCHYCHAPCTNIRKTVNGTFIEIQQICDRLVPGKANLLSRITQLVTFCFHLQFFFLVCFLSKHYECFVSLVVLLLHREHFTSTKGISYYQLFLMSGIVINKCFFRNSLQHRIH